MSKLVREVVLRVRQRRMTWVLLVLCAAAGWLAHSGRPAPAPRPLPPAVRAFVLPLPSVRTISSRTPPLLLRFPIAIRKREAPAAPAGPAWRRSFPSSGVIPDGNDLLLMGDREDQDQICRLRAADGRELGCYQAAVSPLVGPFVAGSLLVGGNMDGTEVLALDKSTGSIVWRSPFGDQEYLRTLTWDGARILVATTTFDETLSPEYTSLLAPG